MNGAGLPSGTRPEVGVSLSETGVSGSQGPCCDLILGEDEHLVSHWEVGLRHAPRCGEDSSAEVGDRVAVSEVMHGCGGAWVMSRRIRRTGSVTRSVRRSSATGGSRMSRFRSVMARRARGLCW